MTGSVRGSVSRQRTRSSTRTQSWLPNPEGGETVFEYALEGDAIRISFKNVDPQQLCQHDAKCAGGVLVWQSAPFSRVSCHRACWSQAEYQN
jgi:hypothetical protein